MLTAHFLAHSSLSEHKYLSRLAKTFFSFGCPIAPVQCNNNGLQFFGLVYPQRILPEQNQPKHRQTFQKNRRPKNI